MNNNQLIISNYYSLHRDEVVSFIAVRIADADEAEDIVQDIFLRLLRGHQLTTPQTLPALIYTMARNAVSDHYRRRHVYEEYEHFIQTSDISLQTADDDTESIFSASQIIERMERTLARLPEACCNIYRLHIYDGMKVSDIAQQLALPYKQVENRLGQARKAVRQQLRNCV
jgi:RNA polymerase sigma-70 factor (ECF subfamily)